MNERSEKYIFQRLLFARLSETARIHLITLMIDDNLPPPKNCVIV